MLVGQPFGASYEPTFRRATLPSGLHVVLQQASETKSGKNRAHLDIEVVDVDAALGQVRAIGGSFVSRIDNEHGSHIVCADLDGNEFCLTQA